MWKKSLLAVVIAGALIAVACGKTAEPPGLSEAISFGEDDYKALGQPTAELGRQLLQQAEADEDGNIFVSPASLFMALSMLQNGAEGETKEEIIQAMQAAGADSETLNRANASYMNRVLDDLEEVELRIANSLWLSDQYTLQDDFRNLASDYYLATADEIDIENPKSADRINDWVKQSTNGKIKEMVASPLRPDLVMYLMNAIYFKAAWVHPFDENATADSIFHLADGNTANVPMMKLAADVPYMENEQFQAVSLPYGQGDVVMDIYVPKEGYDADSIISSRTAEERTSWRDAFEKSQGILYMPKFKLEYEVSLNDLLASIGMKKAFSSSAELSKLVEEGSSLQVSEVLQKTYIGVDEKGTEAAAVTSIGVTESAALGKAFEMRADKPFFFVIRDTAADIILFSGKIMKPSNDK